MTTLITPMGNVADVKFESLLSLLLGSEGKLTIVAQKISVLSGIVRQACHWILTALIALDIPAWLLAPCCLPVQQVGLVWVRREGGLASPKGRSPGVG